MRAMDVLKRVRSGERILVTLTKRAGAGKKYSLTDGTEVSIEQFQSVREFLRPYDAGLLDGVEPQSYIWGG